jgi:transposase
MTSPARCQGSSSLGIRAAFLRWQSTWKCINGAMIENFLGKLKEFKRIALRAAKTDQSFAAMIRLAAAVHKLPMNPNRP